MKIETYKKRIEGIRRRLASSKRPIQTASILNRTIRELAAVLLGLHPGAWHEISKAEAERITGEKCAPWSIAGQNKSQAKD